MNIKNVLYIVILFLVTKNAFMHHSLPIPSLCLPLCWLYCDEQGMYIAEWMNLYAFWNFINSVNSEILLDARCGRDLTIFSAVKQVCFHMKWTFGVVIEFLLLNFPNSS